MYSVRPGRVAVFPCVLSALLCVAFDEARAETQSYIVESVNDSLFHSYPPPSPTRRVQYVFDVVQDSHTETIPIDSPQLRNLSVTLENIGSGLIERPYLYGPEGWDFRSVEKIAASVTSDDNLTKDEKFIRVHEWMGLHFTTVLGGSQSPYSDLDFASHPLRNLNQYGHGMCGQSAYLVGALIRAIPPVGSMKARNVKLGAHRVGEGFWDGGWHAYDPTAGTGVVQWVYYDETGENIAPGWDYLLERPELVSRIESVTGATTARYLPEATGDTYGENTTFKDWDFNHYLRPDESVTMHFDMRGRLDLTSSRQDNNELYRCYSDYGSAVYRYAPDLTGGAYSKYARETNVRRTSDGLAPADPSRPSTLILEMKSAWCFVGAEVKATFRTGGKVYVGVRPSPYSTSYSESDIQWSLLDPGVEEYGKSSIEGKMAYWLKLEFEGEGSGLEEVVVKSEVQMSPWSMPGLCYGTNDIRFEAADMNGSKLRVVYEYDDRSPFHSYQPATSDYGRHIPVRVGGILHKGAKISKFDHGKGRFWDRMHISPTKTIDTTVEIFGVSGQNAGKKVRTLVDRSLRPGWYEFFWNGKDDSGELLPSGMYSYRLGFDGKVVNGERLYLFDGIWPVPNERKNSSKPEPRIVIDPETPRVDQIIRFSWTNEGCDDVNPFCLWNMGDGTVIQANKPLHAYTEPGAYTVLADGMDGGAKVQARAIVTVEEVLPDPTGPGPVLEDEEGKGPPAAPLTIQKLSAKLRYDVPRTQGARADVAFLRLVLGNVPAGWDPAGKALRVDMGGATAEFLLDRKGRGVSHGGAVKPYFRKVKGEFPGGNITARLVLRGDWANEWADEGLLPGDEFSASSLDLDLDVELEGLHFRGSATPSVTARPGKFARVVLGN